MSETIRNDGTGQGPLERGRGAGVLSALDVQFATRVAALYHAPSAGVRWALALACHQEATGHVCADLARLERDGLVAEVAGETRRLPLLATHDSLGAWLEELRASPLVETVESRPHGAGTETPQASKRREVAGVGSPRPLVLDARGRLYLLRAYRHQGELADRILARANAPSHVVDSTWAESAIERLVPGDPDEVSLPREALRVGLERPLAIVTGGPGTGKTTMVARLIALLIELAQRDSSALPRVRLLAPTGKAAAALSNAFARGRESLDVRDEVRAALPTSAETIHRALHRQTRLDAFGRPSRVHLDADVVIVDEASMVDLELMSRLFEACEGVDRVILLGDPGQLASVDSGAVLAELCEGASAETEAPPGPVAPSSSEEGEPAQGDLFASASSSSLPSIATSRPVAGLRDSIVTLQRSHRFDSAGGIGRLAEAIRGGDADELIRLLNDPEVSEIERCEVDSHEDLLSRLVAESRSLHEEIGDAADPRQKLDRMGLYRVLCAHRRGPFGVESISGRLDEAAAAIRHTTPRAGWWLGRMLLVTRNAPDQDLWNGDVGLIEETAQGLRALFPDGSGGVRALSAGRLPSHESALAMSVHKSQGSEFDVVDLVLGDRSSPLMTRELLYTGVTRARNRLRVHASEAILREMVGRRIARDSGLAERLRAD